MTVVQFPVWLLVLVRDLSQYRMTQGRVGWKHQQIERSVKLVAHFLAHKLVFPLQNKPEWRNNGVSSGIRGRKVVKKRRVFCCGQLASRPEWLRRKGDQPVDCTCRVIGVRFQIKGMSIISSPLRPNPSRLLFHGYRQRYTCD
jgi:hypothetical protein